MTGDEFCVWLYNFPSNSLDSPRWTLDVIRKNLFVNWEPPEEMRELLSKGK